LKPIAESRSESIFDAINLVLGLSLFLAPWIFGLSSDSARQDAWYMGAIIALVGTSELTKFEEWAEWLNLTVAGWVIAAPWTFGFYTQTTAVLIHLVVGSIVAVSAAARLHFAHLRDSSHQR
jgi:hypothetical protein